MWHIVLIENKFTQSRSIDHMIQHREEIKVDKKKLQDIPDDRWSVSGIMWQESLLCDFLRHRIRWGGTQMKTQRKFSFAPFKINLHLASFHLILLKAQQTIFSCESFLFLDGLRRRNSNTWARNPTIKSLYFNIESFM